MYGPAHAPPASDVSVSISYSYGLLFNYTEDGLKTRIIRIYNLTITTLIDILVYKVSILSVILNIVQMSRIKTKFLSRSFQRKMQIDLTRVEKKEGSQSPPRVGGKSFKTLSHRRKVAGHGLSLETIPTESSDC